MKTILSFALSFVFAFSFAQEKAYKYGFADAETLQMTSYEKDPEAPALVLYERGAVEIKYNSEDGFYKEFTYKTRVKIFDNAAFDKATYSLRLYISDKGGYREKLTALRAQSYNMDSPPVGISMDDVMIEKKDDNHEYAKFTIPKVKEGTVFDVEYTIRSSYYYVISDWNFQSDIPKLYSEFYTKIPANLKFNGKLVGFLKFSKQDSDIEKKCVEAFYSSAADCAIDTYVMEDIPAFKEEKYMTSKKNYISHITYELRETQNFQGAKKYYTRTWEDVDHEIKTADFGKQARKENAFKKLIPNDLAALPMSIDKAKAIYYYLQNTLVWNGDYHYLFTDIDCKDAFENKKGRREELNLILYNMLKASGFEAYPVLVREREDGVATLLYPVMDEFNYLIVKLVLDEKIYYLDITDKYLPFGLLPLRALNDYGRVVDFKNDSYWDNIYISSLSTSTIFGQFEIDEEGAVTTKMSNKYTGFFAVKRRKSINSKSKDDYIESLENSLSDDNNAFVSNYRNINPTDPEKLLIESFEVEYEDDLNQDQIFLSPLDGLLYDENPFKLEERQYPVNFGYPNGYSINILVKLDDAYEVSNIPESFTYTYDNLLKVDFKVLTQGNDISFKVDFYVYKSVFQPEEYDELKKAFSKLVDINNMTLILKKVKN
ncbi:hypothetical protein [Neptunitalea lumnitzerae]|uniref:DUF3857 domain-containing protein n=1 Tax=Neptunitalea lumnitzerae TaxID=2965509 RepID=A0ABQ5MJY8_9FLAO|nr:hypothetical protein [Neptunitalea sp. Y10]GLB49731.1 hypothetical protein Y10_20990 [Neptunitalea sp. Y10]